MLHMVHEHFMQDSLKPIFNRGAQHKENHKTISSSQQRFSSGVQQYAYPKGDQQSGPPILRRRMDAKRAMHQVCIFHIVDAQSKSQLKALANLKEGCTDSLYNQNLPMSNSVPEAAVLAKKHYKMPASIYFEV